MSKSFEIITGRFGAGRRLSRWYRVIVVLVTLALVQGALLGDLLTGERIMLPLGLLKTQQPAVLVPGTAEPGVSRTGLDLVLQFEPFRKFVVEEYRAGRVPLWNRYSYSGAPFAANAQSGVFSPYRAVDVAFNDPMSTAWVQLFKGLVAGLGMYLFLRIALKVRFLPALAGAHLFTLCGFMLYWCGHPHTQAASWLPWVVLGCDRLVRRPGPGWLALAAGSAALCFYSGHPQTAAHVFLCAGLWAAGLIVHTAVRKPMKVTAVRVGWVIMAGVLGGLLAGPQLLPTLEYLPWSLRLESRAAGKAEFPVAGAWGLMDLVLPYFHGSALQKTKYFGLVNHAESVAAGSVGMVWALFFVPIGLVMRRWDARVWILVVLGLLGLGYALGVPWLGWAYEHGPLAMLSPNRLVLLTGFAVATLGAMGMDWLVRGRRVNFVATGLMIALILSVVGVLVWRVAVLRGPSADASAGWFIGAYAGAIGVGAVLLAAAGGLMFMKGHERAVGLAVGAIAFAEILSLGWGMYRGGERSGFYPRIPTLTWAGEKTGIEYRACGYACFPANLNMVYGIADPRGYDALDPRPMVEMLERFRETRLPRMDPAYASVMAWTPRRSPLLRMLAVRYLIRRGTVPEGMKAAYVGEDYWVMELPDTPTRVYVPGAVVVEGDAAKRVAGLTGPGFDPLRVVVAEKGMLGITPGAAVEGMAEIQEDTGGRIRAKAVMGTPGVMVLADMWYPGWVATVDGKAAEVLRVNHTLKGVALGAGEHEVVFEYKPESFKLGLWMLFVGIGGLCGVWGVWLVREKKR